MDPTAVLKPSDNVKHTPQALAVIEKAQVAHVGPLGSM